MDGRNSRILHEIGDERPLFVVWKVDDDDWWFATDSKGIDKFGAGFDNEQEAIEWAYDRNGHHRRWMDDLMWEIFGQPEQRLTTAHANAHHAIRTGTVTADHFRRLGEAYGAYVKARTS